MPLVTVKTNTSSESIPKDFHIRVTKTLAEVMGKPEERISVTLEPGRSMTRGGTSEPYCEVHVTAIGVESREKTQPVVQQLTKVITDQTGIPSHRVAIWIVSAQPHHIGVNGELMG
ncbi:MIF-like protein mif-2 [Macrobrachium rosenbergii]|uniref:MIF-like protein mif-2 n=1 Tax=Macrobrachium rosenbergii TaxID=79674 RepID=UPI0034D569DB